MVSPSWQTLWGSTIALGRRKKPYNCPPYMPSRCFVQRNMRFRYFLPVSVEPALELQWAVIAEANQFNLSSQGCLFNSTPYLSNNNSKNALLSKSGLSSSLEGSLGGINNSCSVYEDDCSDDDDDLTVGSKLPHRESLPPTITAHLKTKSAHCSASMASSVASLSSSIASL